MNDKNLKKEIEIIKSLLSKNELNKDIVEVDKNNKKLIFYLESIGDREINYETNNPQQIGRIIEIGGKMYLWHKDINNIWIINMYYINKLEF